MSAARLLSAAALLVALGRVRERRRDTVGRAHGHLAVTDADHAAILGATPADDVEAPAPDVPFGRPAPHLR